MIIEKNKVVSVQYTLHIINEDGTEEIAEETKPSEPFVFMVGGGDLIQEFENNLLGKNVGNNFDFIIKAINGYGEYDETALVELPLDAFKNEKGVVDYDMLEEGNEVPMTDSEGNRLIGIIADVNDKLVTMDFNHPFAGCDLHFTGKISAIRDAEAEEISHGHIHGEDGHHH